MAFKARSIDEIFSSMITYKETIPSLTGLDSNVNDNQTLLNELQSDSKTARWVLYMYVHAYNTWVLEQEMEQQITEVEEIRDSSYAGTPAWYAFIAAEFQYGDEVVVDESTNYVPSYTLPDITKQIIEHVATEVIGNTLNLKIRGRDADLLTTEQLNSFISYMNKVKFAGTRLAVQNSDADQLKVIGTIKYNGENDLEELKANVEEAIDDYILNIEFNSEFIKNTMIDRVQAINGVVDFEIDELSGKAYADISFTPITHRYKTVAGYLRISDTSPLNTSLAYEIETN